MALLFAHCFWVSLLAGLGAQKEAEAWLLCELPWGLCNLEVFADRPWLQSQFAP